MKIHEVMGALAQERARERQDIEARVIAELRAQGGARVRDLLEPLRLGPHKTGQLRSVLERLERRGDVVRRIDGDSRQQLWLVRQDG